MADETLDLIVSDPHVLHGQVRFRGTRIPVFVVLDYLSEGMSAEEIYAETPSADCSMGLGGGTWEELW